VANRTRESCHTCVSIGNQGPKPRTPQNDTNILNSGGIKASGDPTALFGRTTAPTPEILGDLDRLNVFT